MSDRMKQFSSAVRTQRRAERQHVINQIKAQLTYALQADFECGASWLNEEKAKQFTKDWPNLNRAITEIMDMDADGYEREDESALDFTLHRTGEH